MIPVITDLKPDLHYGTLAIKLGFVTLERVNECLRIQEKLRTAGRPPRRLGEILVAKGYLTEFQSNEVFRHQGLLGGHQQISGYRILTRIGAGSMGEIYKAVQVSMDRVVAIKILAAKYAQNERFRERFLREARAVARLNHPNIIQGIDVGESNGIHYFAMELVDGPTVGELLRRGGALDEKRALNVVIQVTGALQHAYNHGIIHRDIKPDNIMLTRSGMAKLCDLGLAKVARGASPHETRPGSSMGTPYYISPEQARGEESVDTRSDIYSLGATFYHMVVGDVPFNGESAATVISKHLTEPVTPPRKRNVLISPEMDFVILKMMQKDMEKRYPTPTELLRDLERVARGERPEGYQKTIEISPSLTSKLRRTRMIRSRGRFRKR